jgi:hypothetical protein
MTVHIESQHVFLSVVGSSCELVSVNTCKPPAFSRAMFTSAHRGIHSLDHHCRQKFVMPRGHCVSCCRSGDEPACRSTGQQSSAETGTGTHAQPVAVSRGSDSICKLSPYAEVDKQTGRAGMPQHVHVSSQHFPSEDECFNIITPPVSFSAAVGAGSI